MHRCRNHLTTYSIEKCHSVTYSAGEYVNLHIWSKSSEKLSSIATHYWSRLSLAVWTPIKINTVARASDLAYNKLLLTTSFFLLAPLFFKMFNVVLRLVYILINFFKILEGPLLNHIQRCCRGHCWITEMLERSLLNHSQRRGHCWITVRGGTTAESQSEEGPLLNHSHRGGTTAESQSEMLEGPNFSIQDVLSPQNTPRPLKSWKPRSSP